MKKIIAILASIAWIACTPAIYEYAAAQRALPGIGGEFFWPFMPLIVYFFWRVITDGSEEEVNHEGL